MKPLINRTKQISDLIFLPLIHSFTFNVQLKIYFPSLFINHASNARSQFACRQFDLTQKKSHDLLIDLEVLFCALIN